MCPTLGTTTSAFNGLGMGLATTFVLMLSNLVISLIAGFIPAKVRIPSFIVVIAVFVTVVQLVMQAYVPACMKHWVCFITHCGKLYRVGACRGFASKNKPLDSFLDGLGAGIETLWD